MHVLRIRIHPLHGLLNADPHLPALEWTESLLFEGVKSAIPHERGEKSDIQQRGSIAPPMLATVGYADAARLCKRVARIMTTGTGRRSGSRQTRIEEKLLPEKRQAVVERRPGYSVIARTRDELPSEWIGLLSHGRRCKRSCSEAAHNVAHHDQESPCQRGQSGCTNPCPRA